MSQSAEAFLQILSAPRVGPASAKKLHAWAHENRLSMREAVDSSGALVAALGVRKAEAVASMKSEIVRQLEKQAAQNVSMISIEDPEYPTQLKQRLGKDAPLVITFRGNIELFDVSSVGFCGSRHVTDRGLQAASDSSREFTTSGVNIVSGYAAGVDTVAHRTALENGGTTTIVLAEGLNDFRVKKTFRDVWDWSRVLVVSEFLPWATWNAQSAMQRNYTIAGLSAAMILIEARPSSGSYAAGLAALEMGVPLFAADYRDEPESAEGNRSLIAKGARKLTRNAKTKRPLIDLVMQSVKNNTVFAELPGSEQLGLWAASHEDNLWQGSNAS
ncbi:MAG: DNA-processing protein DprA [Dehalococcoidia bacterium]